MTDEAAGDSMIEAGEQQAEAQAEATTDTGEQVIDSSSAKSDFFGKDYNEVSYKDLGLEEAFVGKFNTLGDLVSGYKEATKKLREKTPEAPEEYTYEPSEGIELPEGYNISEDPVMAKLMPIMKEHNLTQEAFNGLVNSYMEVMQESAVDVGEELKKLGPNGPDLVSEVNSFVSKFSAEEQQLLASLGTTAEGVKLVHKLKGMTGEKRTPDGSSAPVVDIADLKAQAQKIKAETPNFEWDKSAQKSYEDLMNKAAMLELQKKA